jgi:hypothetical protein
MKIAYHVLRAVLQWTFLLLSNVVLDLSGLLTVALALPFRTGGESVSDDRSIIVLPRWAWIWSNDHDGLLGDKRGWWNLNCDSKVLWGLLPLLRRLGIGIPLLTAKSVLSMWWWAAIRNPANNMRRVGLWQAPVTGSTITYIGDRHVRDRAGEGGWQFVLTQNNGHWYYGFYLVHEWSKTKALVVRLGFKVEPDMAGTTDEPKGMTTRIIPTKSL